MPKKISHIGIAVKNLDEAIQFYKKLGLEVEGFELIESQKVKVAFIPIGDIRLELLEPTSEDSTVAKFLVKKGEGIHHIAFEVDEIKAVLKKLRRVFCDKFCIRSKLLDLFLNCFLFIIFPKGLEPFYEARFCKFVPANKLVAVFWQFTV